MWPIRSKAEFSLDACFVALPKKFPPVGIASDKICQGTLGESEKTSAVRTVSAASAR